MYRVKRINKNHLISSRFRNKSHEMIIVGRYKIFASIELSIPTKKNHDKPKYHYESAHVWATLKCFA